MSVFTLIHYVSKIIFYKSYILLLMKVILSHHGKYICSYSYLLHKYLRRASSVPVNVLGTMDSVENKTEIPPHVELTYRKRRGKVRNIAQILFPALT